MSRRLPAAPSPLALAALCLVAMLPASAAPAAAPAPVSVFPIRTDAASLTLNGTWDFRYAAGPMDAAKRPSDFNLDSKITVPGHWELQGFCEPRYKTPDEGAGYYRRAFRIPKNWRAAPEFQRIFLRFEGVLFGFDVWINGKPAGSWASAYNPVTFDITELLHPDARADNTIEVRVTTRNKGWEFDTNDCWGISGIYRDVFLFAAPAAHIQNYTARTTLDAGGGAALAIAVETSGAPAVTGKLFAPDNTLAAQFAGRAANLKIPSPQLWTAETPRLYTLELSIPGQTITEKIGLRQITIDGPVLKLNGAPIKLRGVNHHDIWPDTGRTATVELIRRDLELMRAANINFIRTSHYPPDRRLLDLADEMGFYVMCEVPFGFGDKHLTDPSYQDILLTRARATIARDQNRPSIIVWSVGNENPITDIQLETGREVKRLDPTRPICFPTVGSYFARNYEKFPDFVDIYAPHYPNVSILTRHAQTLDRPVIVTEYAHALGLATERIHALWEIMRTNPNMAGGAIWMFQDQGITRTGDINDPELSKQPYVWPDKNRYYDTGKIDGMDGLVYSDRRPQTDYHETRKVYSPVYIPERVIIFDNETNTPSLHIENRYDFRTLEGINIAWNIEINGTIRASGAIPLKTPAGKQERLTIPMRDFAREFTNGENVSLINILCTDETGLVIYKRSMGMSQSICPSRIECINDATANPSPAVKTDDETTQVEHPKYKITVQRATGRAIIFNASGHKVVDGIYPHTGRRFTEAEKTRIARNPDIIIWPESYLTKTTAINTKVETPALSGLAVAQITIQGDYTGAHGSLEGQLIILAHHDGRIIIDYEYTPVGKGLVLEAGLTLVMPNEATEFRWLGLGPLPNSPGKETAAEYGCHHLARGDLNFSGNRRDTEFALITTASGQGALIAPEILAHSSNDISVEDSPSGIMLSHNAVIASRGNKGAAPEHEHPVEKIKTIRSMLTLIPLSSDWPAPLVRWLGPSTKRVTPDTPYLRSYDQ